MTNIKLYLVLVGYQNKTETAVLLSKHNSGSGFTMCTQHSLIVSLQPSVTADTMQYRIELLTHHKKVLLTLH